MVSYKKTRRKIALSFSILASALILVTTVVIMLFANFVMDRGARNTLDMALQSVSKDYATNQLGEKEVKYQSDNLAKVNSRNLSELPNINQQTIGEIDLEKAEAQKAVYTRVVKANGDIPVTSDLFDTYKISDLSPGFKRVSFGDTCIYILSAKTTSGDTIQNAQYCPFTNSQQTGLFALMGSAALVFSILTYILGLLMARIFLRPLEKSTQQTNEFIQNVYHEMLTPITVAMSTVEATERTKNYQSGIKSVKEDLDSMRDTLITLHDSLNHDLNKQQQTDLAALAEEIIHKYKKQRTSITFHKTKNKIEKHVSDGVAKVILQNLIDNSMKYSPESSVINIELTDRAFVISNELADTKAIDVKQLFMRNYRGENSRGHNGHGLGLAIVKELAMQVGWRVSAEIEKSQLKISLTF